jgi:CRP/FNR family transcriptional regulator, cyclic AMP receptor protein
LAGKQVDWASRRFDANSFMPISVELQSLISRSSWSAGLTEEQLTRVQKDVFERSYFAGAIVCHRGSPPEHWLGVIDGFVKVDTVSKEGRYTTLAGVPAGSWFGEGATLKDTRRPYSVVALRDSKVAFVPLNTFEWLIDNSRPFSRFVINQLNARCGYYVGMVGNLRLNKASTRVAFCLSELFNPQLYTPPDPTLALSQEEIGRLCGLSRQNTNRALRELADAALLIVEYGSVRILDVAGLRDLYHPED